MTTPATQTMDGTGAVAQVRAFNRFYTNVIGLLRGGHLDSPYSLTEVRVLFELARREATEVAALRRSLDIDAGYLSRILARFGSEKLITKQRSATDGRAQVIRLTAAGQAALAELDAKQTEQTAGMLAHLAEPDRRQLLAAMRVIQRVLDGPDSGGGEDGRAARPRAYLLRPPRPGDLGWVIQRHGALYAQEYGWDETFEFLVARIVADYARTRDPRREAAWIAEVDGEPVGCVFCVRQDDATAKLRLLLVEPSVRGMGIGGRLVAECLSFAKAAGYTRMTLWTQDCLTDARRIYQRAGFQLVAEGKHHSFGHDLVEQTWSRLL
ncbi:MAG TPA: helix-turn-helix domain-containing GNAT family N-acetyltransferase [Streptosporangiaceae bacterium]|nr:helix-turn-helix domain-containing GNAT family N-acetyltransferase [Streptosporangiaceae bacterium]